jgi:hypothetical protein
MKREPLDSIEYESTYLELRPARERLTVTTDRPIPACHAAMMRVDAGAVAANPRVATTAEILIAPPGRRAAPTVRPDLALKGVGPSGTVAVHFASGPPERPLHVTGGQSPDVAWGHLTSLRRSRLWMALPSSLLVVVSASLGIVAEANARSARGLFVAIGGILMLAWAWLAWRGTPRTGPFGPAVTRAMDRSVTVLGTFFAVALWARYAPHASAPFSRAIVVVVLCWGRRHRWHTRRRPQPPRVTALSTAMRTPVPATELIVFFLAATDQDGRRLAAWPTSPPAPWGSAPPRPALGTDELLELPLDGDELEPESAADPQIVRERLAQRGHAAPPSGHGRASGRNALRSIFAWRAVVF